METCENNFDTKLSYGNTPYIDLQWEKGKLFISNTVFKLIGKPDGIKLLWDSATPSLIIQPAEIEDPDCFSVIGRRDGLISSVTFIYKIWTVTEWNKTLNYRIIGRHNEQHNVVVFDLNNTIATEIPRKANKTP